MCCCCWFTVYFYFRIGHHSFKNNIDHFALPFSRCIKNVFVQNLFPYHTHTVFYIYIIIYQNAELPKQDGTAMVVRRWHSPYHQLRELPWLYHRCGAGELFFLSAAQGGTVISDKVISDNYMRLSCKVILHYPWLIFLFTSFCFHSGIVIVTLGCTENYHSAFLTDYSDHHRFFSASSAGNIIITYRWVFQSGLLLLSSRSPTLRPFPFYTLPAIPDDGDNFPMV